MEIKLTVPAKYIAVLKLFAAHKDVRYYLNGINFEIGSKESRLVTTNGYLLGCFRIFSEQPQVVAPLTDIIIPNEMLKNIKDKGEVEITVGELIEQANRSFSRPVTLTYDGISVNGKTIDGKYPRYREVIPAKVSGEPAQFDPRFIATLAKAWAILHGTKSAYNVGIGYNKSGPMLFSLGCDDFVGVVSPKSINDVPVTAPDWCKDKLV